MSDDVDLRRYTQLYVEALLNKSHFLWIKPKMFHMRRNIRHVDVSGHELMVKLDTSHLRKGVFRDAEIISWNPQITLEHKQSMPEECSSTLLIDCLAHTKDLCVTRIRQAVI